MSDVRRLRWCLLAVLAPGVVRAGDADEVARLAAANTAAVAAIRTIHFTVKVDDPAGRFGVTRAESWRAGDKIRLHFTHLGNENQAVIRDGVVRYSVRQDVGGSTALKNHSEVKESLDGGRYFWHGGVERYTEASPFLIDPWAAALCKLSDGGKHGNVTFAEFAANNARALRTVRRDGAAGAEVAEYRLGGATVAVHLAPAANYMVRKTERLDDTPNGYTSSAEVTAFREGPPGVFFPARVVVKRKTGGKDEPDEVFTFHDIKINAPIPDAAFDLKFRAGSRVTDRIQGTKYKVDEAGRQVGPAEPMAVSASPAISPADPDPPTETRAEPRRAGWWVLPASVGLLAVSGLWLFARRRALRSPPDNPSPS